jgi:hypothetical protein
LKDYPAFDHCCDGCFVRGSPGKAGYTSLTDLNHRHSTRLDFSFDALQVYVPRGALDALADEQGAPRIRATSRASSAKPAA